MTMQKWNFVAQLVLQKRGNFVLRKQKQKILKMLKETEMAIVQRFLVTMSMVVVDEQSVFHSGVQAQLALICTNLIVFPYKQVMLSERLVQRQMRMSKAVSTSHCRWLN